MPDPLPRWLAGFLGLALVTGCSPAPELHLAGTVERKALELAAPISEVIVEIPVAVGERVEPGQVVVRLDSTVADAELAASLAATAAAQATQEQAAREHGRIAGLRRAKVSSQQDLDRAKRALDEAVALVAERQARVAQAEKRLEALTIKSWGAGVVDELPFEVGERTSAGSVVAVVLADEAPFVQVWVPARSATRLSPGTSARIDVEGLDTPLSGTVEHVGRDAEYTPHYALTERESAHLVYESRIRLHDPPADLRPGLPAQVFLEAPPVQP